MSTQLNPHSTSDRRGISCQNVNYRLQWEAAKDLILLPLSTDALPGDLPYKKRWGGGGGACQKF